MLVIVEGIDRVGKTTLCNKLEKLGFITLKDAFALVDKDGEKKPLMEATSPLFPVYSLGKLDTAIQYIKSLSDKGYNIVADRLHLTELVYGEKDRFWGSLVEKVFLLDDMIAEIFGDDVMLVLVESTGVKAASERAGKDLSTHESLFANVYDSSSIQKKLKTNFYNLTAALYEISQNAFDYDLYFASPFFREDQVEREERLKKHLRHFGFRVFSPKESCHLASTADTESQEKVFNDNVTAIRKSIGVFAITDTKDMGTIWEAGFAFGLNKPILYYAETLGQNLFNLMLAKSGRAVFTDQEQVTEENITKALFLGETSNYGGLIE